MKPAAASGTAPVVARLPRTLVSVQKKWMMSAGPERERVYVEEFAPAFAKLFARLPLHGAPKDLARRRQRKS